jgi:predicted GH43/DUF377 family glycosyl hydrolase
MGMSDRLPLASPYGDVHIGSFDEVIAIPGRYLNDHCLIQKGDQWHFFGIVGTVAPSGKGYGTPPLEVSFAHATSPNLRDWSVHPDVMEISGVWPEIGHVFAPFVVEYGGLFYMLYCTSDERKTQRICLATSEDLFRWSRYPGNPVIVPSAHWSKWPGFGLDAPDGGTFGGCRDPHVIRLDDGRFVAYWVSRLQERFGHDMTCVAASISHDLIHWQEVGPVFAMKAWQEQPTLEVESPCVVLKEGRYWLFFKHGWWTHFAVSDSPFDFQGSEPIRLGFCHASEIFFWEGQWWITHCSGTPDDFMYRLSNRTRGLFLGRLDWPEGSYPRLV